MVGLFSYCSEIYFLITNVFNNRELAIGFWLLVFIIYVLLDDKIRKSLFKGLKVIFTRILFVWYFSMFIYFIIMILFLWKIGFFFFFFLKGTTYWFLAVGITSSFRAVDNAKNMNFFINFIKDNITIFIVIQFIINLHTFSFIIEVIQIFLITIITMTSEIISYNIKPEYKEKNIKKLKNI